MKRLLLPLRLLLFVAISISGAFLCVPTKVSAVELKPVYVVGEIMVKFDPEKMNVASDNGEILAFASRYDLTIESVFQNSNVIHFSFDPLINVEWMVDELEKETTVLYSEPNFIRKRSSSDEYFYKQWYLDYNGGVINNPPVAGENACVVYDYYSLLSGEPYCLLYHSKDSGKNDADIDAADAWGYTNGSSNIRVGVIDGGIDSSHPDLSRNVKGQYNAVHPGNQVVNNNHGTHVAGIIGAQQNNTVGISGVAPNVSIYGYDFFSGDDAGGGGIDAEGRAIEKAINDGVDVLNMSFGGGTPSQIEREKIAQARDAGITIVAAAGNDGTNNDNSPNYPANYGYENGLVNIISVANTDKNDELSKMYAYRNPGAYYIFSGSNYGKKSVHIAAPGTDIFSTVPNNGYMWKSGTSMAAPVVAGVVSLMLSVRGSLSPGVIREVLMNTVDENDALKDNVASGGRVNAYRALLALQDAKIIGFVLKDADTGDTEYTNNPTVGVSFLANHDENSLSAYALTTSATKPDAGAVTSTVGASPNFPTEDGVIVDTTYALPASEGTSTAYLWLKDQYNYVSNGVQDSIVLDQTVPQATGALAELGSNAITISFTEGVYDKVLRTDGISKNHFSFASGSGSGAEITSITHSPGDTRAVLTLNRTINDGDFLESAPSTISINSGIYDRAGNTTAAVTLTLSTGIESITVPETVNNPLNTINGKTLSNVAFSVATVPLTAGGTVTLEVTDGTVTKHCSSGTTNGQTVTTVICDLSGTTRPIDGVYNSTSGSLRIRGKLNSSAYTKGAAITLDTIPPTINGTILPTAGESRIINQNTAHSLTIDVNCVDCTTATLHVNNVNTSVSKTVSNGHIVFSNNDLINAGIAGTNSEVADYTSGKVLSVIGLDSSLNDSASTIIGTYTKDTIAPSVSPSLLSGEYKKGKYVSLESNDSAATIYYTTDSSTPTVGSTAYSGEIEITRAFDLKYFGRDSAGNESTVETQSYEIKSDSNKQRNNDRDDAKNEIRDATDLYNQLAGQTTDRTILDPIEALLAKSNSKYDDEQYRTAENLAKEAYNAAAIALEGMNSVDRNSQLSQESYSTQAAVSELSDIPTNSHLAEVVHFLVQNGIISGFPDGTFKADWNVTRSQLLKMGFNGTGAVTDQCKNVSPDFTDVTSEHTLSQYIVCAYASGIVQGYDDGTFRPDRPVTRIEALKILLSIFNVQLPEGTPLRFKDVKGDEWYAPYVLYALENNLIRAVSDTEFGIHKPMSREEIAEAVYVLIKIST